MLDPQMESPSNLSPPSQKQATSPPWFVDLMIGLFIGGGLICMVGVCAVTITTVLSLRVIVTAPPQYSLPEPVPTESPQFPLLAKQKNNLLPERPGTIDLYLVGVAAYGSQDVFMKEVLYTQTLFDQQFDTKGRSTVLVNNSKTAKTLPLASAANLNEMLTHIGNTLNPEEDILFLFITSHGGEENGVVLEFKPTINTYIPPYYLQKILAESKIKWKVIVVSACYSGAYIDALEDPYTLVMTASRADRTSFGCSDHAEFTWFGEAYFKNQLNQNQERSFIKAFEGAEAQIYQWEERDDYTHSGPQIASDEAIINKLAEFELQLAGR